MKKNFKVIIVLFIAGVLTACTKSLEKIPQGVVFSGSLNTPENVDKMVIAAYSSLGNDHFTVPYSTMWAWGSIRGGDAYKGGAGTGDVGDFHSYEIFSQNRVDIGSTDGLWFRLYVGVSRCNTALGLIDKMTAEQYPQKLQRAAEMKFLRAHYYFLLKILFNHVPYFDETIDRSKYETVGNTELSSDQLWEKIEEDFQYGVDNLPVTQSDKNRITKGAAQAYLAKAQLYQAYKQDEQNNVTTIDQDKLKAVVANCDAVINSGRYQLSADFANNFLSQFENGPETVFAIAFSKDDQTPVGRINSAMELNYPMNAEYGCCGFHQPSSNLVNAFKTDVNGLPMLTTYNDNDIVPGADYQNNRFDVRLDHTVAIPGHPYKYQQNLVFQASWARDILAYGSFMSMKETVAYTDPSFKKNPPFMSSSKDWQVIRYADVLLMKAEALIELGRETEALPLINAVRTRAKNSTALLKQANGTATSNYLVNTYQPGVNCTWTSSYARQALRFERRLEFAMEGYHFFDLVRWGIAAEFINNYFTVEKLRTPHLVGAEFRKNRDEYLPIPQNQLVYSKGLYKQNFGW